MTGAAIPEAALESLYATAGLLVAADQLLTEMHVEQDLMGVAAVVRAARAEAERALTELRL